jgi:hypothetical protein
VSCSGKKAPWSFLSLSFFLFLFLLTRGRQSINQNRTLWHPGPLTYIKPPYAVLFLLTNQFQSRLCEPPEGTDEHHAPCAIPLPTSGIKSSTAPGQTEPHTTKLKIINRKLQSNTNSGGGGGMLNLPQRMGWGKELNSQWRYVGKATKAESRSGETSQSSREPASTQ